MPRVTRLPRYVRRKISARLRAEAKRRTLPRFPSALIVWPPIDTAEQLWDVTARVQWFLPREQFEAPVLVPVMRRGLEPRPADPQSPAALTMVPPKARVTQVPSHEARRAMRARDAVVLLHNVVSVAGGPIAALEAAPFFVVDPTLYFAGEVFEWLRFFYAFGDRAMAAEVRETTGRNLQQLLDRVGGAEWVDVCGAGPGFSKLLAKYVVPHRALIGNQMIKAREITDRLRPLCVAFMSPIDFSPSRYSVEFRTHVAHCVAAHGSRVVVQSGYQAALIAMNCPPLREHLMGLEIVPRLTWPTPAKPEVPETNDNIITALLLPLAHGLQPEQIRVWGCDGRAPDERPRDRRDIWNYLPGLEQDRNLSAAAHPAYFHDQGPFDPDYNDYYRRHCGEVARLVEYIEAQGVPVQSCSPSYIPALHARESLDIDTTEQPSVPCASC